MMKLDGAAQAMTPYRSQAMVPVVEKKPTSGLIRNPNPTFRPCRNDAGEDCGRPSLRSPNWIDELWAKLWGKPAPMPFNDGDLWRCPKCKRIHRASHYQYGLYWRCGSSFTQDHLEEWLKAGGAE
jgi:hypothetical protein